MSLSLLDHLSPSAADLLSRLARGRSAYVQTATLPPAAVAELESAGLADVWDHGPGDRPHAVLSVAAADALDLELSATRRNGHVWAPRGRGIDGGCRNGLGAILACDMADDDDRDPLDVADGKAVDPSVAAERADERVKPTRQSFRTGPPLPIILLGMRAQWPVYREDDAPCPGCGGRRLSIMTACLICDRLGCDFMLPTVPRPPKPKLTSANGKVLAGGVGPAKANGKAAPSGSGFRR